MSQVSAEEQSFINKIHFYSDELTQIQIGEKARDILPTYLLKTMRRERILVSVYQYDPEIQQVRRYLELTPEARAVLEGLDQ